MATAAWFRPVTSHLGFDSIISIVQGEGSALMGRVSRLENVVRGMKAVLDIPLTVKMRTGIYGDKSTAHTIIPQLRDWGVSLVTVRNSIVSIIT